MVADEMLFYGRFAVKGTSFIKFYNSGDMAVTNGVAFSSLRSTPFFVKLHFLSSLKLLNVTP